MSREQLAMKKRKVRKRNELQYAKISNKKLLIANKFPSFVFVGGSRKGRTN